jgi:hypothetical protein
MWAFIKRYLGWYFWLGLYTTGVGALIGVLIFFVLLSGFLAVFLIFVIPKVLIVAVTFAAPLNLVMLPVTFQALRESVERRRAMRVVGAAGGFLSPLLATFVWRWVDPSDGFFREVLQYPSSTFGNVYLFFPFVGAVSGIVCGGAFEARGDKASIFDADAALEAVRKSGGPSVGLASRPATADRVVYSAIYVQASAALICLLALAIGALGAGPMVFFVVGPAALVGFVALLVMIIAALISMVAPRRL